MLRFSQPITAGVMAAVTGFASSFAIVLAGLSAVGASATQLTSALLAVCLLNGVLAMALSWATRLPLSFAWSTPGAALLATAGAVTDQFDAAVGALIVTAALIVVTGCWPALGRLVGRIPASIAAAMLAGILFPICLAPVTASLELPAYALPIVVVWLAARRWAPRAAVPAAMLATAVAVAVYAWGTTPPPASALLPRLEFVAPAWDPAVIVALSVPLYIVTMAGQNLPGFTVLTTFGYRQPVATPVLLSSGAASGVGALFAAPTVNLAALSAAIVAGPEAGEERDHRWIAAFTGGATYVVLGLAAPFATLLVEAAPESLIQAAAGLALMTAMLNAVSTAFEREDQRLVALGTFLVVASGLTIAGIGSAFWGLLAGGALLLTLPRRR
ncbi:benzoate/H(+) symporter BenE family transporter [Zhihengliuella flava]|uniref:Benzoate membrane transport protein n=1 Tax=Zhihengliuella flava TaxID=1285193 RepID=A0A931GI13_9MICC|nr:benzoate/H(+) symporter BenE family transporter [Zhihengliuella flava]MBG6083811.1 benzoate membrane transport protein [Zhihengliuella flava]